MRTFSKSPIIILLVFMLFVESNNIHCQTKIEKIELTTFKTINKLNKKVKSLQNKQVLVNSLNELSNSAIKLFDKIRNDSNFNESDDNLFIDSIEDSQKALNQLLDEWESLDDANRLITDVKNDFDIKLASSPLAAVSEVMTSIEVTVLTKSESGNISGYDVFYTYMWDFKKKEKKNVFTNKTNDAIRNMSPGYYVFWIEKNGEITQTKQKVDIGNLMKPKETLIFTL
nr:hypothetical protein [uncultured Flavobacterium sp.]